MVRRSQSVIVETRKPTVVAEDYASGQAAVDDVVARWGGGTVLLTRPAYDLATPLVMRSHVTLQGISGRNATSLRKTTSAGAGFTRAARGGLAVDDFDVDAVIVVDHAPNAGAERVVIRNVRLTNTNGGGAVGIFAPRMEFSDFEDVLISQVDTAFRGFQVWQSRFARMVASSCNVGYQVISDDVVNPATSEPFVAGTSLHWDTCLATNCATGFGLERVIYSTLTTCGVDHSTADAYRLDRCVAALHGCGAEYGTGRVLNFINESLVDLSAFVSVQPGEVDPAPFADYFAYRFVDSVVSARASWLQTAAGDVIGEGRLEDGARVDLSGSRVAASGSWSVEAGSVLTTG
jgi:hypothetical protein